MPTTPDHPDDDLLADLAAEVLTPELTARVERHVIGCTRCADLLAGAEGVRALLRRSVEPEPIPRDVAARLDAALLSARLQDASTSDDAAPAAGDADSTATPAPGTRRAARAPDTGEIRRRAAIIRPNSGSITRPAAGRATPATGVTPPTGTVPPLPAKDRADGPRTGSMAARAGRRAGAAAQVTRLRRKSGAPVRARRQALEEQRADERTGLVARYGGRLLPVAAGLVVIAAGGAALNASGIGPFGTEAPTAAQSDAATTSERGGGGALDTGSAPGVDGGVPVLTSVLATDTDYTEVGLPDQTRRLVGAARDGTAGQRALISPGAPSAAADSGKGNQSLRSADALRACLTELDAGNAQPVAVDLARYQGREAAVLVVPSVGGGYDVWVVARDCRPGAGGELAFTTVEP